MKVRLILLYIFCLVQYSYGQSPRFMTDDSTIHQINIDTTILIGKKKLYYKIQNSITLCKDFSTLSSNGWVTDFEVITNSKWYVVISDSLFASSNNKSLYKTLNAGLTWEKDTSFYGASKCLFLKKGVPDVFRYWLDVNQIQKLNKDTIIMFIGYYTSAIIYSTDGGVYWKPWFLRDMVNYYGMFECKNKYYLWGLNGDGFFSRMFAFKKSFLFSADSLWDYGSSIVLHPPNSSCSSFNEDCFMYYASSFNPYNECNYFSLKVDSICNVPLSLSFDGNEYMGLNIQKHLDNENLYYVENKAPEKFIKSLVLYDITGNEAMVIKVKLNSSKYIIDLNNLSNGMYILVCELNSGEHKKNKLIK